MGEERGVMDHTSLNDVRERVIRIEERGKIRREWEEKADKRFDEIEASQTTTNKKLDEVIAQIKMAQAAGTLVGKALNLIPAATVAAGVAWLVNLITRGH
jgi:hypothetical protein